MCPQVTSWPPPSVPGWAKCRSKMPERYQKRNPKRTSGHHHFNGSQRGDRRQRRSLKIRPHPAGCDRRVKDLGQVRSFRFLKTSRGVRLCRRPLQKVHQKVIKNRIKKKSRILTPNGLPKGPSKSQKSDQICKMVASNTLRELFWPLSFQKRFPGRPQGPPEPQKISGEI